MGRSVRCPPTFTCLSRARVLRPRRVLGGRGVESLNVPLAVAVLRN